MDLEKHKIKLILTEDQLGTIPKSKEIFKNYITEKARDQKTPEELQQLQIEEVASVEELEEKGWTGFHVDENGLFIYEYMIKGFLKEAGNTMKEIVGIKNIKSKLNNLVFVAPRKMYFKRNGDYIKSADGVFERSLRVDTPMGPRVALARSEFVNAGAELDIEVTIVPNKEITWKRLLQIFEYGSLKGLGQFRNGGFGRFTFEAN
ncbi:MAG TPA: hypothetical protein PLJ37_00680 [Chitinophagales bacterium]|nr:hypothetical protein [Chitinophagales bacterium]HMW93466.1 hypothetical protein [Chitinophagales bacterium]HMZ92911.1 hypothetical protein [Chitinophagales bacterium]HNG25900.1 hypothetical protein [Chitinophagales bacterium]